MKRFSNVLFFADGSSEPSAALARAFTLAQDNIATLTIADVVEPFSTPTEVTSHLAFDLEDMLLQRCKEQLDRLAKGIDPRGLEVMTRVYSGVGFIEIIRAVQHEGFDLLVKPARGAQGLTDRLFGSTDMHLLRKCPCPVWIDQASAKPNYETILAAVDPNDDSDALSRLVLDLATSMAQRESARLNIVHVWRMPGESVIREGRYRLPELELQALLDSTEARHRETLARLLRHYDLAVDDPAVHIVKGTPAPAIRDTAVSLGADLIVMGTVGRTGLPGFFIGNTAEEVLQTATTSVLAVKPAGFESPVV
jgi:nucleotide-binding universal stress UspA family protein